MKASHGRPVQENWTAVPLTKTVVEKDSSLNILTAKGSGGPLRHASHLFPCSGGSSETHAPAGFHDHIGPSIENGFYYDFDTEPFTREDLDNLEKEMKKIIKEGQKLENSPSPGRPPSASWRKGMNRIKWN